MKLTLLTAILLAAIALALFGDDKAGEKWPWREEYPLNASGFRGHATLSLPQTRLKTGEPFTCDIRFTNEGPGGYVFNPFLDPFVRFPLVVAMYDAEHRYVGEYLAQNIMRSRRPPSRANWVYILAHPSYVGSQMRLGVAGRIPGGSTTDPSLPPGRYFLQVIYFRSFVGLSQDNTKPAFRPDSDGEEFDKLFDRTELFRSNVVEVELLE